MTMTAFEKLELHRICAFDVVKIAARCAKTGFTTERNTLNCAAASTLKFGETKVEIAAIYGFIDVVVNRLANVDAGIDNVRKMVC